jgi:ribosomal protein S18 acetylase RimI-like enzyme
VIEIREATEEDNESLIELQNKCPQGTSLVLGVDSSPDFFARSKPFKDWHVFVAVEDNSIVGSAAYAIKDTYVGGKLVKTAYEYGFMVDPQQRRKGIATQLQKYLERVALEKNVDMLHLDIMEDNKPSLNLFSKMGFEKVKDFTTFSLMVYEKQSPVREISIRRMKESDVEKVVAIINEMYRGYNFFHPFKPKDFLNYVERTPYFDLHNILLFQDEQDIKACLGYWDYNNIRKYIVQKFNWRLKTQLFLMKFLGLFTKTPHIPKQGDALSSYNLIMPAFKDTESIKDLIRHLINIALENKIYFLHVPVDPENPIAAVLSRFRHTKIRLHFFIKPLKQKSAPSLGNAKLFIDAAEI